MNELNGLKLGVALCGSFCTFSKAIKNIDDLIALGIDIYPIMSYAAYETSTRFGNADDFIKHIERSTGKSIIHGIAEAEPLGPKNIIDALLIAPCTGNTLAKITSGITDTPVLLAAKSLMRNGKPIIITLASNDALGANLKNIGQMLNKKNIYFTPLGQDHPSNKPYSLVADFTKIKDTLSLALKGQQIQPVMISY